MRPYASSAAFSGAVRPPRRSSRSYSLKKNPKSAWAICRGATRCSLFLDDPTTGLDPQARRQLWELIERFRQAGRTILLTTHYMDEAERLCDRVAIMDHGKIIAAGSPRELIASIGVEHVVEFAAGSQACPL